MTGSSFATHLFCTVSIDFNSHKNKMMSDEELLISIEELLDLGSGATDKEIEQNAFKFIKL